MSEIAAFYGSFYQQPLLLALPSVVWLLILLFGLKPRDGVWKYCAAFAALSICDAFLTANDVLGTGPWTGLAASVVPIFFVVLGDFRVYLWLQKQWPVALGLSVVVPILSLFSGRVLPAAWAGNSRVLYLSYEVMFLVFFSAVTLITVGPRGFKNPQRAYALGYYALWVLADVWLLSSESQATAAWGLRITANLLYYVGWSPWVYFTAIRARAPASPNLPNV